MNAAGPFDDWLTATKTQLIALVTKLNRQSEFEAAVLVQAHLLSLDELDAQLAELGIELAPDVEPDSANPVK